MMPPPTTAAGQLLQPIQKTSATKQNVQNLLILGHLRKAKETGQSVEDLH